MDMIGHCITAIRSGVHHEREIFGPGLIDLMLPNIMHCHDWAYGSVWCADRFPPSVAASARLVRSHIVADWIIHYGSTCTNRKRKCGWAYRRMAEAQKRTRAFFEGAEKEGLLRANARRPENWSKKERLDFSHSIVEYACDAILAISAISRDQLKDICRQLQSMRDPGDRRAVATFRSLGAVSDQSEAFLRRSVAAFAHDGATARYSIDFAVSTTVRKYGFHKSAAANSYVRTFIEDVAASLPADEVYQLCKEVSAAIALPETLYTGDWRPTYSMEGGRHDPRAVRDLDGHT